MAHTAEVVIAYHLRQDGLTGRLMVIERDTTYARATTPMSMGGVRQQYAAPCNIALARYSLQFYEHFDEVMAGAWGRPQAHFHQRGYLLRKPPQRAVLSVPESMLCKKLLDMVQ